ncbi:MAG: hypothetical protein GSR79_03860 [Desulfurococcales archaeon]|nr:hypothetical protein [Desulfurococcales archaeon]
MTEPIEVIVFDWNINEVEATCLYTEKNFSPLRCFSSSLICYLYRNRKYFRGLASSVLSSSILTVTAPQSGGSSPGLPIKTIALFLTVLGEDDLLHHRYHVLTASVQFSLRNNIVA